MNTEGGLIRAQSHQAGSFHTGLGGGGAGVMGERIFVPVTVLSVPKDGQRAEKKN